MRENKENGYERKEKKWRKGRERWRQRGNKNESLEERKRTMNGRKGGKRK